MDFSERLESLELDIKDALRILQQKSTPLRRGSRGTISQDDPIMSRLDGISEKMAHLKGLLESLVKKGGERAQSSQTADNEVSLIDNRIISNASPPSRQAAKTGGGSVAANHMSSIAITDMGFGLIQSLSRYGTDFSGKIHVSGFESFNLEEISNRIANPVKRAASLTVQHSPISKDRVSKLFAPKKQEFKFPDFSKIPESAPQEYEKSFEAIIASTPRKPISYYVGPPLAPDFNTLLSPGKLFELGEIPGLNTPYWHAGEKNSGTAFHYEDGAIRSCNVTIAGFKLWILIKVSSNIRFEDFIQKSYPSATRLPRCSQWLRHLHILISPKVLAEMDIGFDVILAGPGDMVVTAPGQYHAVLNLTTCFAIAINFALPDDPVLAPTIVCPKCGLYGFKHPALQQREGKVTRALRGRHAKRLADQSLEQALAQPEPYEADPLGSTTTTLGQQPSLGAFADNASLAGHGSQGARSGVSHVVTNEDESGSETQAEVAVGIVSREETAEEDTTEDRDSRRPSQLESYLGPVGSPPKNAAASSLSSPSSVTCSTISSESMSATTSTPPSSQNNVLTVRSLQTRDSPDGGSSRDRPLDSPFEPTSPSLEQRSSAQFAGATSSLTRAGTTKRVLSCEDIAKRSRQRLPSAETNLSDELLEADPRCKIPRFDRTAPPDARVLRLATTVRSRYAVRQFCALVDAKRNLQLHNVLFPTYNGSNAARRLIILNGLGNSKTITYINQYLFAVEIDKMKNGMLRLPSATKKEIIEASGLGDRQYEYHLQSGNQWRKVCGVFEGILCFILSNKHNPFHVSAAMYRDMNDHELQVFHNLLADDYTHAICTAGRAFQQSLGARDSYFAWETSNLTSPLHELPEDDMLLQIKPVPLLLEDQHCAAEFPDWPDPTLIPPAHKQCDFCSSHHCDCYISNISNAKPRIMVYPGKGLGLQATSAELGAAVYRRNELIGFLTGKLVPPGTLDDDRVVEFHECQIDCRDEGNEFRLMNHACATHAVARLAKKRVSGRFRQCVVALRNINNGAEITITYSEEHEHPCEGCQAH